MRGDLGPPHCMTFGLGFLDGALDGHLFFPSDVFSGHCYAAGIPSDVISALAECSRRTRVVLVVVGVVL